MNPTHLLVFRLLWIAGALFTLVMCSMGDRSLTQKKAPNYHSPGLWSLAMCVAFWPLTLLIVGIMMIAQIFVRKSS